MSNKKKTGTSSGKPKDRHKKRKMVGVRMPFIKPGQTLADRMGCDFSEFVNAAIREKLEREGLWPPVATSTDS